MSENQTFSGGIEMEHRAKMGQLIIAEINKLGPLLTWLCLRTLHLCRVNKSYNVTAISNDTSEYSEAFVGIFPVLSSNKHNLHTIQTGDSRNLEQSFDTAIVSFVLRFFPLP